jgi:uncharacterized protein (TIGR03663 family)
MASDKVRTNERKQSILTLEQAAWVAVGLLAAGLRLLQLGLRPLNEAEAAQALAAHRFTQGAIPSAPAGTIPALFTANVAGFSLLGASDITARWLPVLAGLILVLLPYWLRHRLGRGGALAASLLLAISATAVYFSRSLDSAIVVAACGLALATGLINYVDSHRPGPLYLAAVALGLGLAAGSATFSLLLIYAAFALLLYLGARLAGRESGWWALVAAWEALRTEKGLMGKAGVTLAASFGLAATTLVLHPGGLGHAADLIGAWVQGILPGAGGQPVFYPLLLLIRYEPLIVLLGLVEAGWVVLGRRADPEWPAPAPHSAHPEPDGGQGKRATPSRSSFPLTAFLTFWALVAAVIILVSGHRPAGNVLLVVVPLALLAGQGTERAWRWVSGHGLWPRAWLVAAVALTLLAFFYLQIGAYVQASPHTTIPIATISVSATTTYLLLALVALLLLAGLGVVVWIWRTPDLVIAGGWLTLAIALGLFGFKAMWGLNFAHAYDPREPMIMQTTAPGVRSLVAAAEALSRDKAGDAHALAITVDEDAGPVLAWYLRDFKDQRLVEDLSAPPDTLAAVTMAAQDLPIGETFRGRAFPLRTHWTPWGRWGQELVRWWLFTEGDLPIVDQEVVLWIATQP